MSFMDGELLFSRPTSKGETARRWDRFRLADHTLGSDPCQANQAPVAPQEILSLRPKEKKCGNRTCGGDA